MRRWTSKAVSLIADLAARLAPLCVIAAAWEITARCVERGIFFFGSPLTVAQQLARGLRSGTLLQDLAYTTMEALAGFLIGTILGTVLGIALGYWPRAATIARPYVIALGVIPIFAIAPILVIWFGIGFVSKVAMAALSTIFVAALQAYEGVCNVDPDQALLLRSIRASRRQLFRHLVLPSAATWVVAGMRLNVGFAILGAFVGEFIASEAGLGHMIVVSTGLFNIPAALAGVFALCTLALALVSIAGLVERSLLPWRRGVNDVLKG